MNCIACVVDENNRGDTPGIAWILGFVAGVAATDGAIDRFAESLCPIHEAIVHGASHELIKIKPALTMLSSIRPIDRPRRPRRG